MKETNFIKKYLLPLSKNFRGSLNLDDDAAILDHFKNENYLISVDNFIQGIHCPTFLNPKLMAIRAILCATSDLAAMGVSPYCILLSISIPKLKNNIILKNIVKGIDQAINMVRIKIAGGDLVSYDGPIAICVTAVGRKNPSQKILLRKGGKEGDYIGVTGYIGDSYIGLNLLQNKVKASNRKQKKIAIDAFLYPPQLHDFAKNLSNYASCCIDISDGLIQDLGKLGELAECRVKLSSKDIPLSDYVKLLIKSKKFILKDFLTAGDDYQLAFTFDEKKLQQIQKLQDKFKLNISVIGQLTNGKGVFLDNKRVSGGFSHL